jgi:hypothetical protein
MTLDEFITQGIIDKALSGAPQRLHVKEPGFSTLYVRIVQRMAAGKLWPVVLDLSSIEAKKPGYGAFKALVKAVRKKYPLLPIYIENVLTPQFAIGLKKMHFINLGPDFSPCFFLPPGELYDQAKRRTLISDDERPIQESAASRNTR